MAMARTVPPLSSPLFCPAQGGGRPRGNGRGTGLAPVSGQEMFRDLDRASVHGGDLGPRSFSHSPHREHDVSSFSASSIKRPQKNKASCQFCSESQ